MPQRKIGRREFLKLAIAAAGAAGLSHFRILNIGGADVAYARLCETGDLNDPDTCDATSVDWCIPDDLGGGDPDICDATQPNSEADMCPDNSPGGDGDVCLQPPAPSDPDECTPLDMPADPDTCSPIADADICVGDLAGDGDLCLVPDDPDVAEACDPADVCNEGPGVPDNCAPPLGNPDTCEPVTGEADFCEAMSGLDPDVCAGDVLGGDICVSQSPDTCSPDWDPDEAGQPNPVTIDSVGVGAASSILPSLGGVVAALGAAALWLRHRLRPEKPEEPEAE